MMLQTEFMDAHPSVPQDPSDLTDGLLWLGHVFEGRNRVDEVEGIVFEGEETIPEERFFP